MQSNTEFHQDWAAKENVGQHIKWKQAVSIDGDDRPKKYKAEFAPRRRSRWPIVLVLFILGAGWLAVEHYNLAALVGLPNLGGSAEKKPVKAKKRTGSRGATRRSDDAARDQSAR